MARGIPVNRWPNSGAFWALVFALAVCGTQIKSLDTEWLHIDEHTFVLMAGHVLDGNLPGVGLFDMKPPGLYYMLAGAFALLGETLRVARLFGDLSVLMLCVATFAVARRWAGPVSSGVAGLAIAVDAAGHTGQATLTDLPAIALYMGALWLLLAKRDQLPAVAGAGVLASAAVLTRLNLAIPAAALGGWLVFAALCRPRWSRGWKPVLLFSAGGLVLPCLLILLYWQADALSALRVGMIDVPLSYRGQMTVGETVVAWFELLWTMAQNRPVVSGLLALGAAAAAATFLGTRRRAENGLSSPEGAGRLPAAARRKPEAAAPAMEQDAAPGGRAEEALLACAFGGIVACLATSGVALRHYAFLASPIGFVYYVRCADWTFRQAKSLSAPVAERLRTTAALVVFAGAGAVFAGGLHGWTQVPPDRPLRRAAEVVAADRRPGDAVWSIDPVIVSWYLDLEPVSPLAYPGDLSKPFIMGPLVESGYLFPDVLGETMDSNPAHLVVRSTGGGSFEPPHFIRNYDARRAEDFGKWVQDRYSLFYDDGRVSVYKANAADEVRP